jgi:hypothetical protein
MVSAIAFSFAQGIFHPYYVSFLAPFTAALVGAGVGQILQGDRHARFLAPLALAGGAVTELVVLGNLSGQLAWARPLVIGFAVAGAVLLALGISARVRSAVLGVALAALLAAPATWAAQTLGQPASGTFPSGGPASAEIGGGAGPGRPGGFGPGGFGAGASNGGRFGAGGSGAALGVGGGGAGGSGARLGFGRGGVPPVGAFRGPRGGFGGGLRGSGFAAGGGVFGGDSASLSAAIKYADAHGGGTIGASSQSTAAAAILSSDADVAGLGGFSGRESSVSATWLAMEVRTGRLRWILNDGGQSSRSAGDSRTGSQAAMRIATKACRAVTISTTGATRVTMYDCQGRAASITAAAARK